MGIILHIETATDVCSVALAENGKLTDVMETSEGRNHAKILTVLIGGLFERNGLAAKDLDAIAISMGPGSYTGLRIGASVAKGLSYGAGIPVIGISTLEAMNWGFRQHFQKIDIQPDSHALFAPMIDARRMEVYTAVFNFQNEMIQPVQAKIIDDESFSSECILAPVYFFGSGADKLIETIIHPNAHFVPDMKPSASFMCEMAFHKFQQKQFEDTAYFEPLYLKDFITTTSKKNPLLLT
jgi:tRNA threonylcarbamoyladenosine biosynthesis protein TsaB